MIKPIMRTKFVLPFVAAGALALGGCYNDESKIHDYMLKRGDSQIALDSVLNATKRNLMKRLNF